MSSPINIHPKTLHNFSLALLLTLFITLPFTNAQDIPDLDYGVAPSIITITYNGGDSFPIGSLVLSFDLDTSMFINSVWGTPWLDWREVSRDGSRYEYTNNVGLDNSALSPGLVITFQFATTPYNPDAIATNIVMTNSNEPIELTPPGSEETETETSLETSADFGNEDISLEPPNPLGDGKIIVAYFESEDETDSTQNPASLTLANLPSYISVVNVAYVRPDAQYGGDFDISNTGLEFEQSGNVIQQAIATLRSNNPNTKVFLSVGGSDYDNWNNFDADAISQLAQDLDVDGVEINYQPENPNCQRSGGSVSCDTDNELQNVVSSMRNALPDGLMLAVAGYNVGAYGAGDYAGSQPVNDYTGLLVQLLQSQYASSIDLINIMAYDVDGDGYDPWEAYQAYQSYYSGAITIGVEVPSGDDDGDSLTMTSLDSLLSSINDSDAKGLMIWSLQEGVDGTPSDNNPSAQMIAQSACQSFDLENCDQELGVITED